MHEHDLDLIMALAEGSLEASEVVAAEAEIAACDECTHELELQQRALALLSAAPPVYMSELEATRMRRALPHELGHEEAATAVAATATKRSRWSWGGALGAVAVLVLVLAVAPTLNLLGVGSDDAANVAFDAALEDTTTAPAAAEETTEAAAEPQEVATDDADLPAAGAAPEADPTTTTAAAAAEEAPALSRSMALAPDTDLEDLEEAYTQSFFDPATEAYAAQGEGTADAGDGNEATCVDTGIAALGNAVTATDVIGTMEFGGQDVLVIAYQTEDGEVVVQAHDPATCEVVASS